MNRPTINVTPLIDVLLVLLIIFMVVSPMKPSSFKTRIPSKPDNTQAGTPNPDALVVALDRENRLSINSEASTATLEDTKALTDRLKAVFDERLANGSNSGLRDAERPYQDMVQRTVFIKASQTAAYGNVARIVDAVKLAGAYPISLQIDQIAP